MDISDIGSIGAGVGMGMINDARSEAMSSRATERQYQANKRMAIWNKEQQIDLFNKTGYEAQVNQMKNAGLNPALMYGSAGGSGSTNLATGNATAQAFESKASKGMEIGIETAMMQANVELMKSQAEKNRVEAEKISGVDTENTTQDTAVKVQTIESLKQEVKSKEAIEQLNRLDYRIKDITQGATINEIEADSKRAVAELRSAEAKGEIDSRTVEESITIIQKEAIASGLRNELLKSNKLLNEAQIKEIDARINKISEDIAQGWKGLEQKDFGNEIETFKAELNAKYPSIMNVSGRVIDDIINNILNIAGGRKNNEEGRARVKRE